MLEDMLSASTSQPVASRDYAAEFSDPCPEAREKLREMCRHM